MNQLIDLIPMNAHARETYRTMPAPARAYALAKAAYEVAHEANFAQQTAAARAATADDPEPTWDGLTREDRLAAYDTWNSWHDRNRERIAAATAPIIARYPNRLKELAAQAEKNMVEWAEDCLRQTYPGRFDAVKGAFAAYREHLLFGDMRERFIKICFNCPG